MPERHHWNGLELQYPENWVLNEEHDALNVESPSGTFLVISRPKNIELAFEKAQKTMEQEYDEVETENVSRVVGEWLLEGITQRFIFLDLVVTSHLFRLQTDDELFPPLLVQIQGEDRDLDRLLEIFDAILASLVRLPA
jgi:hypothetical protein